MTVSDRSRFETIAGRLACYRVLDIAPRYTDRDGRSLTQATPAQKRGGRLEITIGDIPAPLAFDVSNGVPIVESQTVAMQERLEHALLPEPDRDEADLSVARPTFVEDDATYLTLAYVRPATVVSLPDRWALWSADSSTTLIRLNAFRSEAAAVLDRAVSRLPGAIAGINGVAHA